MENLLYAPVMGGFFNVLFDRMTSTDFLNFLRPHKKTTRLLEKLRRKMLRIDKLLIDAEERQTADKDVKSWLDEVKHARYAAEDLVDRIETQALHQKAQAECIGSQIVATVGSIFLNNVDYEIEEICRSFDNLEDQKSSLCLKEIPARGRGPSTSSVDESIIFARDSEKSEIINLIHQMTNQPNEGRSDDRPPDLSKGESSTSASPENKNRIIAITGLSGLGKTTLARYKDEVIQKTCHLKSWVCVSGAHGDIRQIIKTIINSTPSSSSKPESDELFYGCEDLNSLQGRLLSRDSGQGYKFLIVLDDVMDIKSSLLDDPILPLKSVATGGTILSLSQYKITERHLEHLRYLDLSCTSICSLPESVCTFYHLKALLLSDCRNLTCLPDSIGSLKQLMHLNLSRTRITELPRSLFTLCNLHALLLSQCPIGVLPAELGNLTSLCHLDISGTELQHIPVQIGMLSRLQTLTNLIVRRNGGANIEVLRQLRHLKGSLHISNLDDVVSTANEWSQRILQDLGLDRLVLEWNSQIDQPFETASNVYDLLLPVSPPLESMVMKYYNSDIQTCFCSPRFDRLVSLSLEECTVLGPVLGPRTGFLQPCLKDLCIRNLKIISPAKSGLFELSYPQHLETLRIEGLHAHSLYLREIFFPSELHKVHLGSCPELTEITWGYGRYVTCIKKFNIILDRGLSLEALDLTEALDPFTAINLNELRNQVHVQSLHIGGPLLDMDWVIRSCPEIEDLIISDNPHRLRSLPLTLRSLSISCCGSLEFMGSGTYQLLQRLSITGTSYDPSRPFHFGSFMNLAHLEIKGCLGLASISASCVQNLPYLSVFSVSHCPDLLEFSSEGLPAPNLATLSIGECRKLKSLPANMCTSLTSLQSLSIDYCPEINSFPDGGFPPCLHTLCIKNCPMLMSRRTEWPLHQVTCLRKLEIEGCDSTISFPEENFLPASLTHLKITAFRNLSSLVVSELRRLTSLRALEISLCWNLQSFPERMPLSLCYLEIIGCPDLAERCQRDKGRDWSKISHLLGINIGGMDI